MTVQELLEQIAAIYTGADPAALGAMKSAYYAMLKKHEGPALAGAAEEVFGSFEATNRKGFPVPLDFRRLLPSSPSLGSSGGKALDMAGHRERKAGLLVDWKARQGEGIRNARGAVVFRSCEYQAAKLAQVYAWEEKPAAVTLTADQIQTCEDQVVSSERMAAYGAYALRGDGQAWRMQIDEVRGLVRQGISPSAEVKASAIVERPNVPALTQPKVTQKRVESESAVDERNPPPPDGEPEALDW